MSVPDSQIKRNDPSLEPLSIRHMPGLAAQLRKHRDTIIARWSELVCLHLPEADPLTLGEVRDSIPLVIDKIAAALEQANPQVTLVVEEVGQGHGIARAQVSFAIDEFITEYRLLRHVVIEELSGHGSEMLSMMEVQAVTSGVELAMQAGIIAYVRIQTERLKTVAESESRYLAFLSHDVRNNLNSATLMIELLYRRLRELPGMEREVEDVEHLKRSIHQTIDGISQVLNAERVRRESAEASFKPVPLRELAEELLVRHKDDAAHKGLSFRNEVPNEARVHSDRSILLLVLQNLLGNAIKYSSRGTVTLTAWKAGDNWRLLVRDQGEGISPEQVKRLFRAFSRGETHGQSGVGLGLYIASHAAHTLGSELKVESEIGKGSTFYMDLTAAKAATEA